uniref:Uncharacterized protein n=1 Tax=Oryzias melastigma TaxID=30732 RepID=A0A3B3CKF7_ORYME
MKTHLVMMVQEEAELLRDQITELSFRNQQLQRENQLLKEPQTNHKRLKSEDGSEPPMDHTGTRSFQLKSEDFYKVYGAVESVKMNRNRLTPTVDRNDGDGSEMISD